MLLTLLSGKNSNLPGVPRVQVWSLHEGGEITYWHLARFGQANGRYGRPIGTWLQLPDCFEVWTSVKSSGPMDFLDIIVYSPVN